MGYATITGKCVKETSITMLTSDEYLNAEPGTPINPLMISGFWTWIPRFKYRINNTGTVALPSEIDIVFESGTESTGVDINTEGVATTEYYTHPAFRDGSTVYKTTAYDQGGWDSELTGFWVSKYASITTPFKNNSPFRLGRSMASYGTDTYHYMKNTEWGAVAYLSQSKYGKMGNDDYSDTNKEIYINNNSNLYTGRSAGNPSGQAIDFGGYSDSGYICKYNLCAYQKEILSGTGASTTGNIYGVYDMNGGSKEYVMATFDNLIGSSSLTDSYFTTDTNLRYYDSYSSDKTYILGDATYETSGWYNDSAITMDTDNPFLTRGGSYDESSSAGIFNYTKKDGGSSSDTSFRRILIP